MGESYLRRICEALEAGGVRIKHRCRSAAEAKRALQSMGGGVIICGYRLADMTANELSYDISDTTYMLVLASADDLGLIDNDNIFKLPLPASKAEILASVKILMKVEERRFRSALPRRSPEEEKLIARAKELLVEKNDMTEEQSHRFLQQKSMNTGVSKAEVARLIVESYDSIV
ncbi:MAG: ANTAR domain-containing response regulator [Oscillospiraceae bacterium]